MNSHTPANQAAPWATPFELGNGNQTSTWAECIAFYQALARAFPMALHFSEIGVSDGGQPLHAGVVTADGVFDRQTLKDAGRVVFFNNNGIHPGEPEGIDVCMALVRDFCTQPERRAALGEAVFLFIPVYGVDGCRNRGIDVRVNQVGPEAYGFRGNDRNLDLNRDFVKTDSLAAQAFNRFFSAWDPDVMVDTHTSNGADYAYTMTLIHTQTDKLGGGLGDYLRDGMLAQIYPAMERRGWPTCPYVHPVKDTPEDGIEHMLDWPRFSTGYAALHHCIGFMPETHMLKPFADRYAATRALVETVLEITVRDGQQIRALRQAERQACAARARAPLQWRIDLTRPSTFRFRGYRAVQRPSLLGQYLRRVYDREQPWENDIPVYDRCLALSWADVPRAYLVPQAWREVVERLRWNGVQLLAVDKPQPGQARVHHILDLVTRAAPYEGHMYHDNVVLETRLEQVTAADGDWLVPMDQPRARYALETLEPLGPDSFFRWGFFNSILERKEHYSDYLFEDTALELLSQEPELGRAFAAWKLAHPEKISNQQAVLDFIFMNSTRLREPAYRRYPIAALL